MISKTQDQKSSACKKRNFVLARIRNGPSRPGALNKATFIERSVSKPKGLAVAKSLSYDDTIS
jgi:hypothetical protein